MVHRQRSPHLSMLTATTAMWLQRALRQWNLGATPLACANARPPVALFIDGDQIGPRWFPAAKLAAGTRGPVTTAKCFGPPHFQVTWAAALRSCGLEFVGVEIKGVINGDPNDIAICAAADEMAKAAPDTQIATATMDRDFVSLHKRLSTRGVRSFVVVPHVSDLRGFQRAGVDAVKFETPPVENATQGFAKDFEKVFGRPYDHEESAKTFREVGTALMSLGYMPQLYSEARATPTIKALAFFFHVHDMDDAQLHPWCVGAYLARDLLASLGSKALPCPGDLRLFQVAVGKKRPGADGRWIVLRVEPGLVFKVLRWLGYRVTSEVGRAYFNDELECFWLQNAKRLRNNFKEASFSAPLDGGNSSERLKFLERAFSDAKVSQQWRPPPDDTDLRRWLHNEGEIKDVRASEQEVIAAVQRSLLCCSRFSPTPEASASEVAATQEITSYHLVVRLAMYALFNRGRRDPLARSRLA